MLQNPRLYILHFYSSCSFLRWLGSHPFRGTCHSHGCLSVTRFTPSYRCHIHNKNVSGISYQIASFLLFGTFNHPCHSGSSLSVPSVHLSCPADGRGLDAAGRRSRNSWTHVWVFTWCVSVCVSQYIRVPYNCINKLPASYQRSSFLYKHHKIKTTSPILQTQSDGGADASSGGAWTADHSFITFCCCSNKSREVRSRASEAEQPTLNISHYFKWAHMNYRSEAALLSAPTWSLLMTPVRPSATTSHQTRRSPEA